MESRLEEDAQLTGVQEMRVLNLWFDFRAVVALP